MEQESIVPPKKLEEEKKEVVGEEQKSETQPPPAIPVKDESVKPANLEVASVPVESGTINKEPLTSMPKKSEEKTLPSLIARTKTPTRLS